MVQHNGSKQKQQLGSGFGPSRALYTAMTVLKIGIGNLVVA